MIFDLLLDVLATFLNFILGLVGVLSLPENLILVLYDILKYGSWVVGSDLLVIIFGVISMVIAMRLSVGFADFIYRHIPFIG